MDEEQREGEMRTPRDGGDVINRIEGIFLVWRKACHSFHPRRSPVAAPTVAAPTRHVPLMRPPLRFIYASALFEKTRQTDGVSATGGRPRGMGFLGGLGEAWDKPRLGRVGHPKPPACDLCVFGLTPPCHPFELIPHWS